MSVAAIALGWLDVGQCFEVDVGDRFQRFGGGAVAQAVGEYRKPFGILGLKGE